MKSTSTEPTTATLSTTFTNICSKNCKARATRRIILPRVARALQFFEQMFVKVVESVAVVGSVEVDFIYFVNHLPDKRAGLHIIVAVGKNLADNESARVFGLVKRQVLEPLKKLVIHEFQKPVAGNTFLVGRPIAPAQFFGQRRAIFWIDEFALFFLVVKNFQEKHPDKLGKPLGIAVHTRVFAHNI